MSYYDVLQIAESATPEEIRAAYLRLVQQYHPDRHVGETALTTEGARFKRIQEAYEVLHHVEQRAAYDRQRTIPQPRPGVRTSAQRAAVVTPVRPGRPVRRDVPVDWVRRSGGRSRKPRQFRTAVFVGLVFTLAVTLVPRCSRYFESAMVLPASMSPAQNVVDTDANASTSRDVNVDRGFQSQPATLADNSAEQIASDDVSNEAAPVASRRSVKAEDSVPAARRQRVPTSAAWDVGTPPAGFPEPWRPDDSAWLELQAATKSSQSSNFDFAAKLNELRRERAATFELPTTQELDWTKVVAADDDTSDEFVPKQPAADVQVETSNYQLETLPFAEPQFVPPIHDLSSELTLPTSATLVPSTLRNDWAPPSDATIKRDVGLHSHGLSPSKRRMSFSYLDVAIPTFDALTPGTLPSGWPTLTSPTVLDSQSHVQAARRMPTSPANPPIAGGAFPVSRIPTTVLQARPTSVMQLPTLPTLPKYERSRTQSIQPLR